MDELIRTWRDESLKAWAQFLTPVIESNGFIELLGLWSEPLLTAQKNLRKTTALFLEMLDMPSRQNLADLSYRIHQAEKRALQGEEQAEQALATTQRLQERLDAAHIALNETLKCLK